MRVAHERGGRSVPPDGGPDACGGVGEPDGGPSSAKRAPVAARVGSRVLIGLSLILFVVSVPARYAELVALAREASARQVLGDGPVQRFVSDGTYTTPWPCCPWRSPSY